MSTETTDHVVSLRGGIDTSSDEFRFAQAHMLLRQEMEKHGVADETIDSISEDVEIAIEHQTELSHREVREIENVFQPSWYPSLEMKN